MILYKSDVQRGLDLQRNIAVRKLLIRAQARTLCLQTPTFTSYPKYSVYRRYYAMQMYRLMNRSRTECRNAIRARTLQALKRTKFLLPPHPRLCGIPRNLRALPGRLYSLLCSGCTEGCVSTLRV